MRRKEGTTGRGWWEEGNAEEERIEGVTARKRIKKEAALQLESRVQTTLRRVCDRYRLPWCLSRRQTPTVTFIFPLKLCPRTAGFLCKTGCQLIDVSVAPSITWISSSVCPTDSAHPETADSQSIVFSCVVFGFQQSRKKFLMKSLLSCRLQAVCGVSWAGGGAAAAEQNKGSDYNKTQFWVNRHKTASRWYHGIIHGSQIWPDDDVCYSSEFLCLHVYFLSRSS